MSQADLFAPRREPDRWRGVGAGVARPGMGRYPGHRVPGAVGRDQRGAPGLLVGGEPMDVVRGLPAGRGRERDGGGRVRALLLLLSLALALASCAGEVLPGPRGGRDARSADAGDGGTP